MPIVLEGKKLELVRLYDLIDKTNKMLGRHQSSAEPDELVISQLIALKNRFTKELLALLKVLELDFQLAA